MAFFARERVVSAGMMPVWGVPVDRRSDSMTTHRAIMTRAAWIAVLSGESVCDACDGRGHIPRVGKHGTRACPACHGRGVPLTSPSAYVRPRTGGRRHDDAHVQR